MSFFFPFHLAFQVDVIYALFKSGHVTPPVYKNQPPVAGAIGWERSLFYRIKHTILRFQEIDDMLNSDQGKLVSIVFLSDEGPTLATF